RPQPAMATRPGPLTEWPWQRMGNFKVRTTQAIAMLALPPSSSVLCSVPSSSRDAWEEASLEQETRLVELMHQPSKPVLYFQSKCFLLPLLAGLLGYSCVAPAIVVDALHGSALARFSNTSNRKFSFHPLPIPPPLLFCTILPQNQIAPAVTSEVSSFILRRKIYFVSLLNPSQI
uniref:Uncharacterized protein n=1 Tax=Aegilops tauschii subsp. strangulata TaxID=200361 RepID=A0A453P3V2_AEGTS